MPGSAVTRIVCSPWAGLPDLPERRPVLSDDEWDDLLWQASETLYSFTARQYPGGCESYAVLEDEEPGTRRLPVDPVAASGYGGSLSRLYGRGAPRGRLEVALPGYPITEILEVTVDGVVLPAAAYRARLPLGRIRPRNGRPWPGDGSVAFRYRHGLAPPVGGRRSAVTLALEFAKAWTQTGNCKLPKRVETITRENLTVSMLNTFQMVDQGKTGVYEIDLWIAEVNRDRFNAPPTVWSPDIRRATRSTP